MVNFILVQLVLLTLSLAWAKPDLPVRDRVYTESYLGEKNLNSYSERYQPLIFQDIYQGKLSFEDERFLQDYFSPYLFNQEPSLSYFLRSELSGGVTCPDEYLSEHFDDIRYAYRLITISYLLEAQWHLKTLSSHFLSEESCNFDLPAWVDSCRPKSANMKNFLERMKKFNPRYEETFPKTYGPKDWWKEFSKGDFKWYSQYRIKDECQKTCMEGDVPKKINQVCQQNSELMTQLCSEEDSIYGLSVNREAYSLLGQSNIINTFNKHGEAMGCLRRFSQVMSHKEVRYHQINKLFPSIQAFLNQNNQGRFLQGRVFFFGSGKEFEEKGLKDFYVVQQPFKSNELPPEPADPVVGPEIVTKIETKTKLQPVEVAKTATAAPKKVLSQEMKTPVKSAFLQAAEVRASQNLDQVEVDMLKLKYDYVFTLNQMNTLSERLKTFMTREALEEMKNYDKLGTRAGPVPILFIKFLIDMQEHQGLWNILMVLGDKFYVSNEIDAKLKPSPELIRLVNNESTGKQWQIFILKPE